MTNIFQACACNSDSLSDPLGTIIISQFLLLPVPVCLTFSHKNAVSESSPVWESEKITEQNVFDDRERREAFHHDRRQGLLACLT